MVTADVTVTNEYGTAVVHVEIINKSGIIPEAYHVRALRGEPFKRFSSMGGPYSSQDATVFKENLFNVREEKPNGDGMLVVIPQNQLELVEA
ncbi:hypothetical protein SDC9_192864 [bioreactor metagenome]|jgi:hypothetical protein|uniref:Uncharacterized protein n=1 Tax=bioreactor metagenome TaxID=1076179 RepID=A0A645I1X3_9ZZZZ